MNHIVLGTGNYLISNINHKNGHRGIIFKYVEIPQEIGVVSKVEDHEYYPRESDFEIKCLNIESAKILLEVVEDLVKRFETEKIDS